MAKDDLHFEIHEEAQLGTRIKVIGIGGAGSNAVARMMSQGFTGVEFYVLNTDLQALQASPVPNKIAIGRKVTSGLGAGADPQIGRLAALEDTDRIIEILEGGDMVFITAGMGGGTGTGATPVVASLAKELNALTVAVVTRPFAFEGPRRMKQAERGLADLAASVDTVLSIPNDKLLELAPKGTSFVEAFRLADDVLRQAVQGIADIITTPGVINRDFSDVKAIMLGMGYAMMGTANARGENAAVDAARQAISSKLLEDGGVKGARGILINISGSSQLSLHDVNEACGLIRAAAENDDVQINFGIVMNEAMADEVKVTVLATGFQRDNLPAIVRQSPKFEDKRVNSAAPSYTIAKPVDYIEPPPPESNILYESEITHEPEIAPEEPQIVEAQPETVPANGSDQVHDIELPAFLRRERKLFQ